jgi:hypothetical protein
MRLLLSHGRFDPDEQLEEWGFNGPDLDGVEALHVTYQTTFVLHFKDAAAAQKAQALTGWPYFDCDALELAFHDDMLKVCPIASDGPIAYYGDYELQEVPNAQH